MLPSTQDVAAPIHLELRDKALNLRDSVNSSRARMNAHRERLEHLKAQLVELRALVNAPLPGEATPAPVAKETAAVPAPAAVSLEADAPFLSWKTAPYAAILILGVGMQAIPGSRTEAASRPPLSTPTPIASAIPSAPSPAPLLDDDGADEALLLAHDWRLPGDEQPLAERLGAGTNPPGSQPEWSAERTGERTYRVSFRANGSDAGYDFDVDLAARQVDPTPETAELISPRLASRR